MSNYLSEVDGIEYDAEPGAGTGGSPTVYHPGLSLGRLLKWIGLTNNTIASAVANQQAGTVACPAIASGATGTVTITNSFVTAGSRIFPAIRRRATSGDSGTAPAAGAAAGLVAACQIPASGSVVVELRNAGSAATLSTDYVLDYFIVRP